MRRCILFADGCATIELIAGDVRRRYLVNIKTKGC